MEDFSVVSGFITIEYSCLFTEEHFTRERECIILAQPLRKFAILLSEKYLSEGPISIAQGSGGKGRWEEGKKMKLRTSYFFSSLFVCLARYTTISVQDSFFPSCPQPLSFCCCFRSPFSIDNIKWSMLNRGNISAHHRSTLYCRIKFRGCHRETDNQLILGGGLTLTLAFHAEPTIFCSLFWPYFYICIIGPSNNRTWQGKVVCVSLSNT